MITINGVDLPSPASFKYTRSDLDSSDTGRNELGIMQRDRIRQGVYSLDLEWKGLTSSQLHLIETAVEPASLTVRFPTPAGYQTKRMYVSDRSIEMIIYKDNIDKIRWDISFKLVEY